MNLRWRRSAQIHLTEPSLTFLYLGLLGGVPVKNPVWWYHENKAVEHGYLPTMLTLCNYLGLIVTHYSLNSVYCLLLLGKQYLGAHPLFCNCWDILVNIFVNTSFLHFYFHFLAHAKDCSGGDWGYIIGRKSLDLAQGGVNSIQQGWQWIWWWWWWWYIFV